MKKDTSFPRAMKCIAMVTFALTVALVLLCRFCRRDWILAAAISAGTTFYHFAIRLLIGSIVPRLIKHPRKRKWFQQRNFEPKLYSILKVRQWKDRMPTYDPASFSLRHHSLDEILHNGCVSEAVHEVIMVFSFLPLLFSLWWGAFPVFLITSLLSAAFDGCFVIMQRYNRPRLIRILEIKEANAQ